MNAIEIAICQCGTPFEREIEPDRIDGVLTLIMPQTHCPNCQASLRVEYERREAARRELLAQQKADELQQAQRRTLDAVTKATPPRFQTTDVSHPKFNARAWQRLKGWSPTNEHPWLGLGGETGTCKTRVSYLLASDYLQSITTSDRRPTFAFMAAYDLGPAVMRLFSNDYSDKARARAVLDLLRTADFLLLDDLGKLRLTPAIAEEVFSLLNHRHEYLLTTIWTANSQPEEIAAGLPPDMAAPFAGRLLECSKIVRLQ